jgi:excinuclease ABC subunit C
MRGGKLTGRDRYRAKSAADDWDSFSTFVMSYYNAERVPAAKIYVQLVNPQLADKPLADGQADEKAADFENGAVLISRFFISVFGRAPEIKSPDEKRHEAALAMARQNAVEDIRKRVKERGAGAALDELRDALKLRRRPDRIEGFDIAQLEGRHPVASLIAFRDGISDRKNYRIFNLKSVVGIVDDFSAMREAVRRRYSRLIKEGGPLPDLILVDGGIGQVNAAKGVLDELKFDVDVAGLAKRDEELWLPYAKAPIVLDKRSEALKVLQAVRDETHRFATTRNQKLRSKDISFGILESVEGIGKKRAALLMKTFGTLDAMRGASAADIATRAGISMEKAKTLLAALRIAGEEQNASRLRLKRPAQHDLPYSNILRDRTSLAGLLAADATVEYGKDQGSTDLSNHKPHERH